MRSMRWWQFGLFGGVILSLATAVKVIQVIIRGIVGEFEWADAIGFTAAIFGMGFLCGFIVWIGRDLYHRIGMVGDAIVGVAVMVAFFISCMFLFNPVALGAKFLYDGVFLLGMAVIIGLIGGA